MISDILIELVDNADHYENDTHYHPDVLAELQAIRDRALRLYDYLYLSPSSHPDGIPSFEEWQRITDIDNQETAP